MPSDWYAYRPPSGGFGQAGTMQRLGRFQGHIEGDSGTLQVLDVKGQLTMGEKGVLSGGQDAYDSGTGFWLEYNSGTPRLSLGNSSGDKLTWDGSGLNITGGATLASGTIGGWTINSASLSQGTGATTVGLATSGGYSIYAGSATASSAPFSVTPAGAMKAESGTIGGWTISSSALSLGSGGTARGIDSGSTAFYAGSATPSSAPFRVTSAGALTATSATITGAITASSGSITGTVTIGSGGKLAFGASGADYLDDNILHFEVGTSEESVIESKNSSNSYYGTVGAYAGATQATQRINAKNSSDANHYGYVAANVTSTVGQAQLLASKNTSHQANLLMQSSATDCYLQLTLAGTATLNIEETNLAAKFAGYIYPGTGSAQQTSRYIYDASSNINVATDTLYISGNSGAAGIRWENIANGGSATAWSGFGTANIPDSSAGYIKINIAGTNYRVPIYADS